MLNRELVSIRSVESSNATIDIMEVEANVMVREPPQEARHRESGNRLVPLCAPAENDVVALIELSIELPDIFRRMLSVGIEDKDAVPVGGFGRRQTAGRVETVLRVRDQVHTSISAHQIVDNLSRGV